MLAGGSVRRTMHRRSALCLPPRLLSPLCIHHEFGAITLLYEYGRPFSIDVDKAASSQLTIRLGKLSAVSSSFREGFRLSHSLQNSKAITVAQADGPAPIKSATAAAATAKAGQGCSRRSSAASTTAVDSVEVAKPTEAAGLTSAAAQVDSPDRDGETRPAVASAESNSPDSQSGPNDGSTGSDEKAAASQSAANPETTEPSVERQAPPNLRLPLSPQPEFDTDDEDRRRSVMQPTAAHHSARKRRQSLLLRFMLRGADEEWVATSDQARAIERQLESAEEGWRKSVYVGIDGDVRRAELVLALFVIGRGIIEHVILHPEACGLGMVQGQRGE